MKVEDLQEYPNNPRNNKESIEKAKEIGAEEINKYGTIIKFYCMQEKDFPKRGRET